MAEQYLTLADLAKRAGLAESTARRYIKTFPEYFLTRREGQRVLYALEGSEILQEVARLYSEGLYTGQVAEKLREAFSAFQDVESGETSLMDQGREVESREALIKILEKLADQKEELNRLEKQQEKGQERTKEALEEERKAREALEERIKDLEARKPGIFNTFLKWLKGK